MCGQEILSTTLSAIPQYIHLLHADNGVTDTFKYANLVSGMFTSNSTKCPITGYKIMSNIAGTIQVYTGTNVKISGNDILVSTATALRNVDYFVEANTDSGITKQQKLFVKVCGDEVVSLTNTNMPFIKYNYNRGTK